MMHLPNECIEEIIVQLPLIQRFQLATDFELTYIQWQCAPLVACCTGSVALLDAWKTKTGGSNPNGDVMALASKYGHTGVLEWWKQSRLLSLVWLDPPDEYGRVTMTATTRDILMSGSQAITGLNAASEYGHVHVLDWWIGIGSNVCMFLQLPPMNRAMALASQNGHIRVLEWWNRIAEVSRETVALDENWNQDVLDWWILLSLRRRNRIR